MSDKYDVILVGSGHNGLVAAGYLAKAGKKVLVLERNPHLGGGVVTSELAAPGFLHDWHSTIHAGIQANPLIRNDELGLLSQFGLNYIRPDALASTIFEDHDSIVVYADIEKTCESIGRVSPRDAQAYRALAAESAAVRPLLAQGMFTPPPAQGAMWAMLDQSPQGRKLMQVMQRSMLDVANEHFHHEKVKVHFLKMACGGAFTDPSEKGTGASLFAIPGFVHHTPWAIPEGGSAALVKALVRCLEHYGAEFRTNSDVEKILVEQGRATGVRLAGGETIHARTVIGQIHPWLLGDMVQDIDPDIAREARNTQTCSYTSMDSFYALKEAPKYHAGEEPSRVVVTHFAPASLETFMRSFVDFRYGDLSQKPLMAALNLARWDPSRAPDGGATLAYYIYVPFNLRDGGSAGWDARKAEYQRFSREKFAAYCSNFTDDNIVGSAFQTPADTARYSPTFQQGDPGGIGKYFFHFGGHRPTPALAQYAVPGADGLYLAGACMHPGGGVTGGGRATAIRICDDLNIDFDRLC